MNPLDKLSRDVFGAFALRGLRYLKALESDANWLPYMEWLSQEMQMFAEGKRRRLLVSLPPRHLKTYLSICLAAWIMGRIPSAKILVLSHSERLAEKFAYAVRELMKSAFYQRTFTTRIAANRSILMDFMTTERGGVRSASVNGSVTGFGADFIIVDDPMQIRHWDDLARMDNLYDSFANEFMTRLNNPAKDCVMVIGHRLNADDLFGRLYAEGGWKRLKLPLIANRDRRYQLPDGQIWHRKRGELLRPGAYTKTEIRRRRRAKAPGFNTLDQQSPDKTRFRPVKKSDFRTFDPQSLGPAGVVLSIDPGQGRESYSVVQAWTSAKGGRYCLLDQWRAQASYQQLRAATRRFIRIYRPGVVLVESAAHGPALIDELQSRGDMQVISITPTENKFSRTKRIFSQIRRGNVMVPEGAPWLSDYIEEFTGYPDSRNDDQIDATSQALDWLRKNFLPPAHRPASKAVLVTGTQVSGNPISGFGRGGSILIDSAPGAALARYVPARRIY